ncbi:cytochrome P450 [Amylostereum chailletii]|nr:cytochrome P450 [Amylostereum chailletii]
MVSLDARVHGISQLRDIWLAKASQTSRKDGKLQLDAFKWLNKATLDIIGLTGFNYSFNALRLPDGQIDELYEAIVTAGSAESSSPLFRSLQLIFPPARLIIVTSYEQPTTYTRNAKRSLDVVHRIGNRLVSEKKAAVLNEAGGKRTIAKDDIEGHDLLSLLIKANMAADMPDSMRLTDAEVRDQVPTFLAAGHETTSTAVSWTLFALSTHKSVQAKLREELLSVTTDTPSMDELGSLRYLGYVVQEALRLYAPVPVSQREATQPEVVPVATPFVDANGETQYSIRLNAGDVINIPIHALNGSIVINIPIRALNRSIDIWGEDAREFRPERWEHLPEAVQTMPGVFSHILTFLGGTRACIGFRFSIVEAQALLFTLIRAFEIELAVSPDEIIRRTMLVGRPWVDGALTGPQLPLLIRPVQKA